MERNPFMEKLGNCRGTTFKQACFGRSATSRVLCCGFNTIGANRLVAATATAMRVFLLLLCAALTAGLVQAARIRGADAVIKDAESKKNGKQPNFVFILVRC